MNKKKFGYWTVYVGILAAAFTWGWNLDKFK